MDGHCSTLQTGAGWLQSLLAFRNNPLMFTMAILVASLNIADAFFTQVIIAHGGAEVNPIAQAAISTFGNHFWLWKHTVVSLCVIILSSHIHLRMARVSLGIAAFFYSGVMVWHMILIDSIRPFV
ncbi:MAG TPA: DUF5658 family protein [Syntrophales bacterium]|nr:DUF5658 family protein [Syntrophales bacterium]